MDGRADPKGQGENPTEAVPRDITCVHAGSHGPARAIRHAAPAARSGRLDRARRRCGAVRRAADEAPDRRRLRGARLGLPGGLRGAQALPRRPDRAADPRLRQQQEGSPRPLPPRSTRPRRRSRGSRTWPCRPRPRPRPRPPATSRSCCWRSTSRAAPTPRSMPPWTCARTSTSRTTATWRCPCTSSASRRCGRACRTSPRRTSRRPSSPASRSSSSSCSPSSARSPRRCCRSASGWRPSCSPGRRSTSSRRRCRCRSS